MPERPMLLIANHRKLSWVGLLLSLSLMPMLMMTTLTSWMPDTGDWSSCLLICLVALVMSAMLFISFLCSPAEWFGLDDPVLASEFQITTVWDSDRQCEVPLQPHERHGSFQSFWVCLRAWALHFCNTAVEYGMSKVIPPSEFVKGGMPPPQICGPAQWLVSMLTIFVPLVF